MEQSTRERPVRSHRWDTNRRNDGRQNNMIRAMNFEKYASDGNRFVNEVADELGVHRNVAARITRAVLHAVRDRLPADDAVQFGQGLPMAIKGVYFDQYDISRTPVVIRHAGDFLQYICMKDGRVGFRDFPEPEFVEDGLHAVFAVLERHMDYGQIEQIRRLISAEIAEMMYC
jgi:uncharacterized protein (DUF2267 family)